MLDRDHSCGSTLPGWEARQYGTPPLFKSHSHGPQARRPTHQTYTNF